MKQSSYRLVHRAIIIFIALSPVLSSATAPYTGRIIDYNTGEGIPMVNVAIPGTTRGAVSDAEGRFTITLEAGQTLRLSHIAYEELEYLPEAMGQIIDIALTPRYLLGEKVLVTATRGSEDRTPIAFTTVEQGDLTESAPIEDVPMALSGVPGVYAFSDAGHGIGYTYLKIRGFDQDRIGVMVNGIPLNDPESHQVYWVDHGGILSSTGSIQLQRGVGNSLYGTTAFGGSVNLVTSPRATPAGISIQSGYGDYLDAGFSSPDRKLAVQWAGQPLKGRALTLYGRFSGIRSDGYRIGSGTRQDALHLMAEYLQPEASTKLEVLSGHEVTHFSWDGIAPLWTDIDDREARRYNFYADSSENGGRTDANKDVFTQNIYSLQHARKMLDGIFSISLYGVTGRGYYEQFKGEVSAIEYNLAGLSPAKVNEVDIIRRKWLVNGYVGFVPQYTVRSELGQTVVGGDIRIYSADHYGQVRSVDQFEIPGPQKYYQYITGKTSISMYLHQIFELGDALNLMFDIKYTRHAYTFDQDTLGAFTKGYKYQLGYSFIDPRMGLRYTLNDRVSTFLNLSKAQREPADSDIYNADDPGAIPALQGAPVQTKDLDRALVDHEELWDLEFGLRYRSAKFFLMTNLYQMWFQNELIPIDYRTITDDGVPIHGNADLTVHQGVEVEFKRRFSERLALEGSLTWADNRFEDYSTFEEHVGDTCAVVNHGGNVIPGHPTSLGHLKISWMSSLLDVWCDGSYRGLMYIDRQNTQEAAIDPATIFNVGLTFKVPIPERFPLSALEFRMKMDNVLDTLYETYGYNYWWVDRVDVYWPAATRRYFAEVNLRF
ncbi:MAG: TonB-dependent receptor [Fidelibacterota bacterium]|nr:MAG: TonB-dependent receptor [Candidatus Neomarinimicrobiota bacterium]